MVRVLIAGSKDRMDDVVGTLQDAHLVHVVDFHGEDGEPALRPGDATSSAGPVSANLTKVRSSMSQIGVEDMGAPLKEGPRSEGDVRKAMPSVVKRIDSEIATLVSRRSALRERLTVARKEMDALHPFIDLGVPPSMLSGYDFLFVFVGTTRKDFRPALDRSLGSYEIFGSPGDARRLFALFVGKVDIDPAARLLEENGFAAVKVPEPGIRPEERCGELQDELAEIANEMADIESRLSRHGREMAAAMLEAQELLELDIERAEAPMRFATTDNAFIITGWVPAEAAKGLESTVHRVAGEGVHIEFEAPKKGEDVPVATDNLHASRPFEVLTGLMGLPSYDEIDPTILMSLGIPLFFGFMLGDIGYGIVLLAMVACGLFGKMLEFLGMGGSRKQLTFIIVLCAISSIVFGFLFNEFFGFELLEFSAATSEAHVLLPAVHYPEFSVFIPLWGIIGFPVSRIHETMSLLVLTLIIGIVHIALGLLIGLRNTWVAHGAKAAVLEKGSWLFILIGGTFFLGYYLVTKDGDPPYESMSIWMLTGVPMFITGIGLLLVGEGPLGVMHIFSLLSNTLSYARLLAIGISSVAIAMVFNSLALKTMEPGGITIVFGVLLLVLGHTINILLGILGPTLHSLRLHLVEFFLKFYDGSGRPFVPFGRSRTYTAAANGAGAGAMAKDGGGGAKWDDAAHDHDNGPPWGTIKGT